MFGSSVCGARALKPCATRAAGARGAQRRQPQRAVCRATTVTPPYTSGSSSSSSSGFRGGGASAAPPLPDAAQLSRRLGELQELLQEVLQVAVATGPRGLARSAQAASALLSVAREQAQRLQAGQAPEGPAPVLRKLFERLGATYIKLGQFVASRWARLCCRCAAEAPVALPCARPSCTPDAAAACWPAPPLSPTLFPEEYVLEFQKCLDSTEPVPFEVIR